MDPLEIDPTRSIERLIGPTTANLFSRLREVVIPKKTPKCEGRGERIKEREKERERETRVLGQASLSFPFPQLRNQSDDSRD